MKGATFLISFGPHTSDYLHRPETDMRRQRKTKDHFAGAQGAIPLYVLSDSTGNLARHMVTTFLTQFPPQTFATQIKPFVSEPQRMSEAFAAIGARPGIVLHAVVPPQLKKDIVDRCGKLKVPCHDLTGPAVDFLADAARVQSHADQQSLHKVDNVYCGRINAMAFTLEHDDGLGMDSLADADIVLAGVSRTGKTPTSIYLAMQGFRVANMSLAMGATVPEPLMKLGPGKAVGLVIDPVRLVEIRDRRRSSWQMPRTQYSDPHQVAEEIEWSRRLFNKQRFPVLDVTDQAIEETAARVLDLLGLADPIHPAEARLT
jgi:hypothetical protein